MVPRILQIALASPRQDDRDDTAMASNAESATSAEYARAGMTRRIHSKPINAASRKDVQACHGSSCNQAPIPPLARPCSAGIEEKIFPIARVHKLAIGVTQRFARISYMKIQLQLAVLNQSAAGKE